MPETNNLHDLGMSDWLPAGARQVDWTDPLLARIVRLRFLSDPGFPFWDLSYCWGEMRNGERVRVNTPFFQVPKNNRNGHILACARRDGVYAKELGVFDAISTLT